MHDYPGVLDLNIKKFAVPFKSGVRKSSLKQLGLLFMFVYSLEKNLKFH